MVDDSLKILVIILSVFLALFLILSIYLITRLIQISNNVKKIIEHAEKVADKAEHVSGFFTKTATPIAILKLISNSFEMVKKKNKNSNKKED